MPHDGARFTLEDFVTESNRIEGLPPASIEEVESHRVILEAPAVTVRLLAGFVWEVARAPLRDRPGMNVRVGNHLPPPGGPFISEALEGVLRTEQWESPFSQHVAYETLHPFMDGNGRSGRVLWLRSMGGIERAPLGFLHHFYYQALDARR